MSDESKRTQSSGLLIAVYGLAIAIPVLTRMYVNAPISMVALLFLILTVASLGYTARKRAETFPWVRYVSSLVNAIAGLLLLVGILITPLSAYNSWFDSFRFGTPDGGVSNLFVLITGYFAAVLSPMMLTMGVLWPIIMTAFVVLYLLAIIIQAQIYLVLVLAFLVVPSAYLAIRSANRIRREGVLTFSLAILGVAFLVAMAIPRFDTPPGDEFVNDTLYPKLRKQVVANFPRFPLLYSVPGYGISFDEKQLGGTPTLLPNPIFEVTGNPREVLYLRTRIFDTYDGSSWAMSPYFAGRTTDALRSQVFGDPSDVRDSDLRIELTAKTFGFIPYTLDTDVIFVERGFPRISEGSVDTGFRLQEPLRREDVVYLRRSERSQTSTIPISAAERRLYLQIPGDLPPELLVIADGLSRDVEDPEQILANIEAFLAQNYTYSLEIEEFAPDVDMGGDFVYSFLFSQTGGYCVQFATSFIILARLNGIPARYATGYLSYMPADDRVADVTGLSSHAWPEVWVEGRGWVNWEATPAVNLANYSNLGADWVFNFDMEMNAATSRQIEGLLGASIGNEAADDGSSGGLAGRIWRIALLSLTGLAGAAGVSLGLFFGVRGVRHMARDEDGRFYHKAKQMSHSLKKHGMPLPERVGWLAWFSELGEHVPVEGDEMTSMRGLMMRLTYTDEAVTDDHIEAISTFSRYVRKQIRSTNGNGDGNGQTSVG